ncbi:hypothetical protein C4D60_Mb01t12620 [Musa balbisiana]|uniref:Uncharacterized protein n=1 Tax=Musa balbisiana TaxID=52838 RepID=A0A4S8JNT6_MUSBA|nr:hypothetical protein C4D60_Mb01t12620 [Musa balbisiana]
MWPCRDLADLNVLPQTWHWCGARAGAVSLCHPLRWGGGRTISKGGNRSGGISRPYFSSSSSASSSENTGSASTVRDGSLPSSSPPAPPSSAAARPPPPPPPERWGGGTGACAALIGVVRADGVGVRRGSKHSAPNRGVARGSAAFRWRLVCTVSEKDNCDDICPFSGTVNSCHLIVGYLVITMT